MHLRSWVCVCASLAGGFAANDVSVVGIDFKAIRTRVEGTPESVHLRRRYAKRDDTVSLVLENSLTSYSAWLSVGTPGQNISVILDTGSSDLWVMASGNPYCEGSSDSDIPSSLQINCEDVQTFDSSKSSTFSSNNTDFTITYGDTSFANGTFAQDTVDINGASISNANFAVASEANTSEAVFGIGPMYGESIVTTVNPEGVVTPTYENVLISMKNQGYIETVSFSLFLNDANTGYGTVLFGGVDHAKYSGDLTLMPILTTYDAGSESIDLQQPQSLTVQLTGVDLYNGDTSATVATCGVPVLLDSGTSLTYLPTEIVDAIGKSLGAIYSESVGMYITTCDHSGGIVYELAGKKLQVPFKEMIFYLIDYSSGSAANATDENGDAICGLGILPSGSYSEDGVYILGDTFLRGVYAAFDYENWQLGIAAASYNGTGSTIEAIGTSGIPSATSAPSYSATSFVSSLSTSVVSIFTSEGSIDQQRTYVAETSGANPDVTSTASSGSSDSSSGSTVTSGAASSASHSSSDSKNAGGIASPSLLSYLFIIASSCI